MEKVTKNSMFNPLFKNYKSNLDIDLYQDLKTLGVRSFHNSYGISSVLYYLSFRGVRDPSTVSDYGNQEKLRQRVQQLENIK